VAVSSAEAGGVPGAADGGEELTADAGSSPWRLS
jgi:hypothetical protein